MKIASPRGFIRHLWSTPLHLLALSVFFAGILLGEVNWLGSRRYVRADLSATSRYSLSEPTLALLRGQSAEVELVVTLPPNDPLFDPLRHLIDSYRSVTPLVTSTRIHPGREPLALAALAGAAPPADLALIARRGERKVFVSRDKLVRVEQEQARRSLEQTISNAIAEALEGDQLRVCFPTGQGEPSIEDVGLEGLAPLRQHLGRLGFLAERTPLDVPRPVGALKDCAIIFVAAPARPYPPQHADALLSASKAGAHLILALEPIATENGTVLGSGLDRLTREFGLELERGFLIEQDPNARLPEGMGEIFFAEPEVHRVTEGLSRSDERRDARPLIVSAGAITIQDPARAKPLLKTSPEARLLLSLGALGSDPAPKSQIIAAAAERLPAPDADPSRMVIFAFANLLHSVSDPTMIADRILLENALDWVIDRRPKVSLPPRPTAPSEPFFTEASLGAAQRYLLAYIPASTAAIGFLVLLRRKRQGRSGSGGRS